MREYKLTCGLWLPIPVDKVFPFFADAANLSRITPPWLRFTVTSPQPMVIETGCTIDYTIRWLGIPMKWRTLIPLYEPPLRFKDQQISGPYAKWVHLHSFESKDGGTVVHDEVEYRLPWSFAGHIAHTLLVRRQLEGIFNFRQQSLVNLLLAGNTQAARVIERVNIVSREVVDP
ncbi:MAG: SRPBCC family protein [Phycisphaerales bacterium]|nr:SRPBCC family protein [Phycisphaerales bacterium]